MIQLTGDRLNCEQEILAIDENANTLILNDKLGDGFAINEHVDFDVGTFEIQSYRTEPLAASDYYYEGRKS